MSATYERLAARYPDLFRGVPPPEKKEESLWKQWLFETFPQLNEEMLVRTGKGVFVIALTVSFAVAAVFTGLGAVGAIGALTHALNAGALLKATTLTATAGGLTLSSLGSPAHALLCGMHEYSDDNLCDLSRFLGGALVGTASVLALYTLYLKATGKPDNLGLLDPMEEFFTFHNK